VYLSLKPGWSISTSGTSERQFEFGGQKLSHILDPRTGWPVSGSRSATAVVRSGRRSEVLSKRLLLQSAKMSTAMASQFKDFDWVYLEKSPTGTLKLEANSRRTKLYTTSSQHLQES
jgi:thiamine biosynthesis lipoprotein ApbE